MKRIVIVGTSGSGKSWLAERLGARLGLPVMELDALFWGPGWQPAPLDLFRHRIQCEIRHGSWIVAGNYLQVQDLVWGAADTLVWLDLPLAVVMAQLVKRTFRRIVTRQDLWGTGNRETVGRSLLSRDSILLWALRTHRRNQVRFLAESRRVAAAKHVVRLRSRREIARFLNATPDRLDKMD